jgi:hypothetical protein
MEKCFYRTVLQALDGLYCRKNLRCFAVFIENLMFCEDILKHSLPTALEENQCPLTNMRYLKRFPILSEGLVRANCPRATRTRYCVANFSAG